MNQNHLIFCPLDCGARIKSLSKHLTKCKNYKLLGITYKKCEYNSSHIIKNEFYELHLISCESKKKFEEIENDSNNEDLKDKLNDDLIGLKKNNNKNEEKIEEHKIMVEKDIKENTDINRRKKRYNHEKALFKDEAEIDGECLVFFNKVYV